MLAEELLCKAAPWNERVQEMLLTEEAKKATIGINDQSQRLFTLFWEKIVFPHMWNFRIRKMDLKSLWKVTPENFPSAVKNDCSVSYIQVDGNVKCRNKWKPAGSLWNRTNTPVAGLHDKSRFVSWYLASEKLLIFAHALLPSTCWVFARTAGWVLWKWI